MKIKINFRSFLTRPFIQEFWAGISNLSDCVMTGDITRYSTFYFSREIEKEIVKKLNDDRQCGRFHVIYLWIHE